MIRFFLLKQQQVAAGFGLFGGGDIGSSPYKTSSVVKYSFSANTVTSSGNLSVAKSYASACGNLTVGIFAGGQDTSYAKPLPCDKYTFASNIVSGATSLNTGTYRQAAAGNASLGIFGGGDPYATQKYTYSTDSVTSMSVALYTTYCAAVGTTSFGLWGGGGDGNRDMYKYTYSNDSVANATLLPLGRGSGRLAAFGNSTVGIFGGGYRAGLILNSTNKYVYSDNTCIASTSLLTERSNLSAAGDSNIGIFAGGANNSLSYLNVTEKYTFSNDSVITATSLLQSSTNHAACSSTPGHL